MSCEYAFHSWASAAVQSADLSVTHPGPRRDLERGATKGRDLDNGAPPSSRGNSSHALNEERDHETDDGHEVHHARPQRTVWLAREERDLVA